MPWSISEAMSIEIFVDECISIIYCKELIWDKRMYCFVAKICHVRKVLWNGMTTGSIATVKYYNVFLNVYCLDSLLITNPTQPES